MKVGDKVEFDPEHELGFWDYDPERDPRGKILEIVSIRDGVATAFCLIGDEEHWHTAEQKMFIKIEENKATTQGATK